MDALRPKSGGFRRPTAGTGRDRRVGALTGLALLAGCSPTPPPDKGEIGELNISRFVFRDSNRNGRYELGERPYAGLGVELSRPGRGSVIRASNISGFANFRMSLGQPDREIDAPGELTFTALPPSGWMLTTGEPASRTRALEKPNSPGGLVVDPILPIVGVAPVLTVAGRTTPGASVRMVGPDGKAFDVVGDSAGAFSAPATAGAWRVDWSPGNGADDARRIAVGEWAVFAARPTEGALAAKARTIIADFDGLTPSDTLFELPEGYAGVDWRNWVATHQKYYRGDGYINAAVSGEYVAYNSSGHPAWISAERPFDFVGAHVAVAWTSGEEADIVVSAFRGEEKIGEERLRGATEGAIRFDADWRGVTRVEFSHDNYWQIVLDDVTLRVD